MAGNPRGGVLQCSATETDDFSYKKGVLDPYLYSWIGVTVVFFVMAVIFCYCWFKEEPAQKDRTEYDTLQEVAV